MRKALSAIIISVIFAFAASDHAAAQSVSCPFINFSAGHVLDLPCATGVQCTTLSATLPDIRTTGSYTVDSITYNPPYAFTIPGATAVVLTFDDYYSPLVHLPFNFCFYGKTYSSVAIGANGIITFDSTYANNPCTYQMYTLPSGNYASPSILPAFHDMDPSIQSTNPRIEYYLAGTAPCRQLVVNYRTIGQYGSACVGNTVTFQVVLYENTNVVEVYIKDKPACLGWQGGKATCGLQNDSATQAITAPGKNNSVWGSANYNKAYRFVPNGTSLLNGQVQLVQNGTVLQSVTPAITSPGQLTASFPNICVNAFDSAKYVVHAAYVSCSGVALSPTDTILVRNITVTPPPTAASPVSYCQSALASPLTATGTSLRWYTSATGGTGNPIAPTPSTGTPGSFVYYVSQTINNCESARLPITVIIKSATSGTANAQICPGGTISWGGMAITSSGTYTHTFTNAAGCDSFATLVVTLSSAITTSFSVAICQGQSYFYNGTIYTTTGNYSATYTSVSGCDSIRTLNLTVNPIPSAPIVISPVNYCQNTTAAPLTATGSNLLWYTTATGGTGNTVAPIPVTTTVGTTTYYVSQTTNGCESPRASIQVVINSATSFTTTASICQGQSYPFNGTTYSATGTYTVHYNTSKGCDSANTLVLTVNPLPGAPAVASPVSICQFTAPAALTAIGTNLLWYTAPTGGTGTNVAPSPPTGAVGSITYYVSQTTNGCEGPRIAITVNVTASPVVTVSPAAAAICAGQSVVLTASGANTYSWSPATGLNTATGNTVTATPAATTTYTVTGTAIGGCSNIATATVTVNQIPATPVASSNSPLCVGNTLLLNAQSSTSGVTYSWTGPLSYTSSLQSPSITNPGTANSGTYSVTASANGCTSAAGTTSVLITVPPAAPAVNQSSYTYCQFDPATVLIATGTGLRWYTVATGGTALPAAPIPSTAVAGTFTYYVSQTTSGCEGPRALVTVVVKAKPAPPVTVLNLAYCQYDVPASLTATGTNVLWYLTPTGGVGTVAPPTFSTFVPGTLNFYVTQAANGCTSDRAQINVVINPKPAPPTVNPVIVLCQGDVVGPLTAMGINLHWYQTATGGVGSATAPVPNTLAVSSTIYYVTQSVNGCESDRTQIIVDVRMKPNGIILASKDKICRNDTLNFNYFGSAPASAVYNWQFPAGSMVQSGSGAGPYNVLFPKAGNLVIRLTVDNGGCLSPVATFNVNVRPLPELHSVFKPDVCVDEPVTVALNTSNFGANVINWNFGGAEVLGSTDNRGPYVIAYHQPGLFNIITSGTNPDGCNAIPDTGRIIVHELPVASILNKSFGNICATDTIALQAQDGAGYSYHWSPEAFFDVNGAAAIQARVNITGYIHLDVQNEFACRSMDSVFIETHPCCTVTLPGAFSPNGDGKNEVFRIISPAVQRIVSFRIVNRWGQVVWETDRAERGWDGKYNGVPQDMGAFNYYIKYQCEDGKYYDQKGEFILMR